MRVINSSAAALSGRRSRNIWAGVRYTSQYGVQGTYQPRLGVAEVSLDARVDMFLWTLKFSLGLAISPQPVEKRHEQLDL